jgi:hypothetical protein
VVCTIARLCPSDRCGDSSDCRPDNRLFHGDVVDKTFDGASKGSLTCSGMADPNGSAAALVEWVITKQGRGWVVVTHPVVSCLDELEQISGRNR